MCSSAFRVAQRTPHLPAGQSSKFETDCCTVASVFSIFAAGHLVQKSGCKLLAHNGLAIKYRFRWQRRHRTWLKGVETKQLPFPATEGANPMLKPLGKP